ncbi:hypothetical protein HPP92_006480 [Vanilla planifolia]|uniref:RRM domain-containing protein n=1 Tax=Vanilla planifolia TaxID=51239 RepID=A0A835RPE7_VANPL|nr:hypothetical protein HPP92_006480 [Vanilla planifolia]
MGVLENSPSPAPAGATALTKVFVGGLAWETQKAALLDHFGKFGDILEAVVISDKLTGRSKGYGFVTFRNPEAAKKACEDATPVINGRRTNCNLASLGSRQTAGKFSPPVTPSPPPLNHQVGHPQPWYFPAGSTPPVRSCSPFHRGVLPFYASSPYGYTSSYIAATNLGYNTKFSEAAVAGSYLPGMMIPGSVMQLYPPYPLRYICPATGQHGVATVPAFGTKPIEVRPPTGTALMKCGGILR